MEPIAEVPPPVDPNSGVSGDQQPGGRQEIAATPPPLEGQLLQRTFIGLVADSPDRYGGAQNAPIIGALIQDFAYEKEQARSLAAEKQHLLDQATNALNEQKLVNGRLEERLKQNARSNRLQKYCIFAAPILGSIAIDLFKANLTIPSYLIAAVGLGLLLAAAIFHAGEN